MQTGWAYAVSVFSKQLPDVMVARVLGVLGLVTAGFLLFVLLTSNPFERLVPAPIEGMDLNPLLRSEEHTSELQSLMRISYAAFCLIHRYHNSYSLLPLLRCLLHSSHLPPLFFSL